MTFLFIAVFALMGGWVSRMCGGGRPFGWFKYGSRLWELRLPWGLDQWVYALPYGIIFVITGQLSWIVLPVSLLALCAAAWGKRLGHGQYIHLGYLYRQPTSQDESLDPIIRFFFGPDRGGNYWRCVAGLALTGVAVTILPGVLLILRGSPLAGLLLAFSGATKPLPYMLGWWLVNKRINVRPTFIGEVGTGITGWGLLACCYLISN